MYKLSRKVHKIQYISALLGLVVGPLAQGQEDHAGPREVVGKVQKAAALLAAEGEAGLDILRDSTSEYMWKDTYVFAVNCDADEVLANPAFPDRVGGDIKQHTDYNGKQYGLELCEMAKTPGGAWIEYVWPRPGGGEPMRKISYVVSVDGRPYQVGAGIYDEAMTLDHLQKLVKGQAQ
jgi:signal transduction histidine kinase